MSFIHVPAIRGKCPAPTLFGASIRARGRRQGRWDGARSRARPIAMPVHPGPSVCVIECLSLPRLRFSGYSLRSARLSRA